MPVITMGTRRAAAVCANRNNGKLYGRPAGAPAVTGAERIKSPRKRLL